MENKVKMYNVALHLFEASKLLKEFDERVSEELLDLAEKYTVKIENWDISKKDGDEIRKYKELLCSKKT